MATTITAPLEESVACFACGERFLWADYLRHAPLHPLPHPDDRRTWEASRRTFLGASEIPALLGASPYRGPLDLWADKVLPRLEDAGPSPDRFRLGHLLEGPLLQDYADRHGVRISRPSTARHPEAPFLGATPDGETEEGVLVQVKLVGQGPARHWGRAEEGHVPEYVLAQVQAEMEVADRDRAVVLALLNSTDLREITVERDRDLGAAIREAATAFWESYVLTRTPPPPESRVEVETIRRLFPAATAPLEEATAEEAEILMALAQARAATSRAEAEEDRLRAQAMALIGSREGLSVPGGRVTFKAPKGSTNWPAVAKGWPAALEARITAILGPLPEIPEIVKATQESLIWDHTPATGTRRLDVRIKGLE